MIESKMDQKAAEKDFPKLMIKLYFVSGPSRSTICEKKYVELLIQAMCLESGDDSTDYTDTELEGEEVLSFAQRKVHEFDLTDLKWRN